MRKLRAFRPTAGEILENRDAGMDIVAPLYLKPEV